LGMSKVAVNRKRRRTEGKAGPQRLGGALAGVCGKKRAWVSARPHSCWRKGKKEGNFVCRWRHFVVGAKAKWLDGEEGGVRIQPGAPGPAVYLSGAIRRAGRQEKREAWEWRRWRGFPR